MYRDQHRRPVPLDLVVLDIEPGMVEGNEEILFAAAWYECQGVLMASAERIRHLSAASPESAGVLLAVGPIVHVPDTRKRYHPETGFTLA
jgi:hypothetical protein